MKVFSNPIFILLMTVLAFRSEYSLAANILEMNPYLSGRDLQKKFTENPNSEFRKELGEYVDVSLDYNNSKSSKISIYYHTIQPFNSQKPTFLFFQGGPGDANHSIYEDTFKNFIDWNIILFDYRGIGFSYPNKLEELKNTNYFSSEFTARDANQILEKLGVKKVSVYGHSYGTEVATIFSSLFEDKVNAVVLEGTIYAGDKIWNSEYGRPTLQKIFNELPPETQRKILKINETTKTYDWFSILGHFLIYEPDFKKAFTKKIEELINYPDTQINDYVKNIISSNSKENLTDTEFSSYHHFYHIACKELNLMNVTANSTTTFNGNRLVSSGINEDLEICNSLGIRKEQTKTYQASNFKLKIPVTYFQGSNDNATPAEYANLHFKAVAQNKAQLFLAVNSGHTPLQDLLSSENTDSRTISEQLLKDALKGKIINADAFKKMINGSELQNWELLRRP